MEEFGLEQGNWPDLSWRLNEICISGVDYRSARCSQLGRLGAPGIRVWAAPAAYVVVRGTVASVDGLWIMALRGTAVGLVENRLKETVEGDDVAGAEVVPDADGDELEAWRRAFGALAALALAVANANAEATRGAKMYMTNYRESSECKECRRVEADCVLLDGWEGWRDGERGGRGLPIPGLKRDPCAINRSHSFGGCSRLQHILQQPHYLDCDTWLMHSRSLALRARCSVRRGRQTWAQRHVRLPVTIRAISGDRPVKSWRPLTGIVNPRLLNHPCPQLTAESLPMLTHVN